MWVRCPEGDGAKKSDAWFHFSFFVFAWLQVTCYTTRYRFLSNRRLHNFAMWRKEFLVYLELRKSRQNPYWIKLSRPLRTQAFKISSTENHHKLWIFSRQTNCFEILFSRTAKVFTDWVSILVHHWRGEKTMKILSTFQLLNREHTNVVWWVSTGGLTSHKTHLFSFKHLPSISPELQYLWFRIKIWIHWIH